MDLAHTYACVFKHPCPPMPIWFSLAEALVLAISGRSQVFYTYVLESPKIADIQLCSNSTIVPYKQTR